MHFIFGLIPRRNKYQCSFVKGVIDCLALFVRTVFISVKIKTAIAHCYDVGIISVY